MRFRAPSGTPRVSVEGVEFEVVDGLLDAPGYLRPSLESAGFSVVEGAEHTAVDLVPRRPARTTREVEATLPAPPTPAPAPKPLTFSHVPSEGDDAPDIASPPRALRPRAVSGDQ